MSKAEAYYEAQKDMMEKDINILKNRQSIAEEFEKRQNIKDKTHTTISTTVNPREDHAADAMSWFAKWKRKEQNAIYGLDTGEGKDTWATYAHMLPSNFLNISEDLDSVLGSSDLMKRLNELCLRDDSELYVRELLNRLHKIIDYCDNWKIVDQVDYDIAPHMEYIVKLARGEDEK